MAELGDAFDPKAYAGLFSDPIPADRDAALATMAGVLRHVSSGLSRFLG